jgi:hypothetical protein
MSAVDGASPSVKNFSDEVGSSQRTISDPYGLNTIDVYQMADSESLFNEVASIGFALYPNSQCAHNVTDRAPSDKSSRAKSNKSRSSTVGRSGLATSDRSGRAVSEKAVLRRSNRSTRTQKNKLVPPVTKTGGKRVNTTTDQQSDNGSSVIPSRSSQHAMVFPSYLDSLSESEIRSLLANGVSGLESQPSIGQFDVHSTSPQGVLPIEHPNLGIEGQLAQNGVKASDRPEIDVVKRFKHVGIMSKPEIIKSKKEDIKK